MLVLVWDETATRVNSLGFIPSVSAIGLVLWISVWSEEICTSCNWITIWPYIDAGSRWWFTDLRPLIDHTFKQDCQSLRWLLTVVQIRQPTLIVEPTGWWWRVSSVCYRLYILIRSLQCLQIYCDDHDSPSCKGYSSFGVTSWIYIFVLSYPHRYFILIIIIVSIKMHKVPWFVVDITNCSYLDESVTTLMLIVDLFMLFVAW